MTGIKVVIEDNSAQAMVPTSFSANGSSFLDTNIFGCTPDDLLEFESGEVVIIRLTTDQLSESAKIKYARVIDQGVALIPATIM